MTRIRLGRLRITPLTLLRSTVLRLITSLRLTLREGRRNTLALRVLAWTVRVVTRPRMFIVVALSLDRPHTWGPERVIRRLTSLRSLEPRCLIVNYLRRPRRQTRRFVSMAPWLTRLREQTWIPTCTFINTRLLALTRTNLVP